MNDKNIFEKKKTILELNAQSSINYINISAIGVFTIILTVLLSKDLNIVVDTAENRWSIVLVVLIIGFLIIAFLHDRLNAIKTSIAKLK
ncbi:MAG: hypothetical protein ACP5NV_03475 [Candidatus Woesearchaeota archaeon]